MNSTYTEFLVERTVAPTRDVVAYPTDGCSRRYIVKLPVIGDGLTDEGIMTLYTGRQREHQPKKLSSSQKERASELWSAQLRTKIAEQKTKDDAKKVSVVVDFDDE